MCRYKGWKKIWPKNLQTDNVVGQCHKFTSRTTRSLYGTSSHSDVIHMQRVRFVPNPRDLQSRSRSVRHPAADQRSGLSSERIPPLFLWGPGTAATVGNTSFSRNRRLSRGCKETRMDRLIRGNFRRTFHLRSTLEKNPIW
jgi:hypothetical protein